jgi:hypothetical protein
VTSCDIAKSTLARRGVSYVNESAEPGALAVIRVGGQVVESVEGRGLAEAALASARAQFESRLGRALGNAGYPEIADPEEVNIVYVAVIIMIMVTFVVMVFAPMATMAIEIFPTRIRYSALSLPYHIGSGWFGGFLPAIAFAMVAATGDIYFGLWYPVVVAGIGAVILAFFLSETKDRDIRRL